MRSLLKKLLEGAFELPCFAIGTDISGGLCGTTPRCELSTCDVGLSKSAAHFRRIMGERRGSLLGLLSRGVGVPELREAWAWPRLKNQRDPLANAVSASVSTDIGRSEPVCGGVVEMRGTGTSVLGSETTSAWSIT